MTSIAADLNHAETEARNLVQRAVDDHAEAAKLLAALEERVREGDPGVKPKEIGDARDLVRYAELQIETAHREAAKSLTAARHALYAAVGAEARRFSDTEHHSGLAEAFAVAVDAMHRLWDITDARSATLRDLSTRAAALGEIAKANGEQSQLRQAGVGTASLRDVAIVGTDGAAVRKHDVAPHELLVYLVDEFLRDVERRQRADHANWSGGHFLGAVWNGQFHTAPLTEALQSAGARRAEAEFGHLSLRS